MSYIDHYLASVIEIQFKMSGIIGGKSESGAVKRKRKRQDEAVHEGITIATFENTIGR